MHGLTPSRAGPGVPRLRCRVGVVLHHRGARIDADLFDISPLGGRIDLADTGQFRIGEPARFSIPGGLEATGSIRWVGRSAIGLAFDPPLRAWELENWLFEAQGRDGNLPVADRPAPSRGEPGTIRQWGQVVAIGSKGPGRDSRQ